MSLSNKDVLAMHGKGEIATARLLSFLQTVEAARFFLEDGKFLEALISLDTAEFYTVTEAVKEAAAESKEAEKAITAAGLEAIRRKEYLQTISLDKAPYAGAELPTDDGMLYGKVPAGLMRKYELTQRVHHARAGFNLSGIPGLICDVCRENYPCQNIRDVEAEIEAQVKPLNLTPEFMAAAEIENPAPSPVSPLEVETEPSDSEIREHSAPGFAMSNMDKDNVAELIYVRGSVKIEGPVNWDAADRQRNIVKRHNPRIGSGFPPICDQCQEPYPCGTIRNVEGRLRLMIAEEVVKVDEAPAEPEEVIPAAPEAAPIESVPENPAPEPAELYSGVTPEEVESMQEERIAEGFPTARRPKHKKGINPDSGNEYIPPPESR